jgi:hypothetical protein
MYTFSVMESGDISGLEIVLQGVTSDGVGIARFGSDIFMVYQNGFEDGGRYFAQKMEIVD